MRRGLVLSLFASALLLGLITLPGPADLAGPAQATHRGDIECPTSPLPEPDGSVSPGEYLENFFDPLTKTLIYFTCGLDAGRTMHTAVITPWAGWTELRFQAADEWNGQYNVVRVSMPEDTVEAVDGFLAGADSAFANDLTLGGTNDVLNVAAGRGSESYVYEFSFPLLSADSFDSRLRSNGSFSFQVAHASESFTVLESEPHFLQIGQFPAQGRWTSVEMSVPAGNEPLNDSEIVVTLRDDRSRPLAFRPLSVFAQTTFGFLDLGSVLTNEQGLASVTYMPRDEGEYLVGAAFAGEEGYLASVEWMPLVLTSAPPPTSLLPRDRLVIQTLIILVVGGVWITYGYSLLIVRQAVRGEGEEAGRGMKEVPGQPPRQGG